jgi:DNA-binding response OmpR family regulator
MVDNIKKTKILLIEDDVFLSNIYSKKFESEGFEMLIALDGEKGLKLALSKEPDLILLDLLLPGLNGFEVLKALRKDERAKKIPVILLTNLSQKEDIEKGLALKADDYLIKTHFMPSEIVEKIKKFLGKTSFKSEIQSTKS